MAAHPRGEHARSLRPEVVRAARPWWLPPMRPLSGEKADAAVWAGSTRLAVAGRSVSAATAAAIGKTAGPRRLGKKTAGNCYGAAPDRRVSRRRNYCGSFTRPPVSESAFISSPLVFTALVIFLSSPSSAHSASKLAYLDPVCWTAQLKSHHPSRMCPLSSAHDNEYPPHGPARDTLITSH